MTKIFIIFFILFLSANAFAYQLPYYKISDADISTSSEEVLAGYESKLDSIGRQVKLCRLDESSRNPQIKLSKRERSFVKEVLETNTSITFWKYVVSFKKSLLVLHGSPVDTQTVSEADLLAKKLIERIYSISQEYKVSTSALIQNLLVTTGIKKKGYCYHYVGDLRDTLQKYTWRYFDIYWGASWEGNWRENNSLVITAKGQPFEDGITVDAWRSAGKPFWTKVKGDSYPWKKSVM